jgi:hypothetical protein
VDDHELNTSRGASLMRANSNRCEGNVEIPAKGQVQHTCASFDPENTLLSARTGKRDDTQYMLA